MGYQKADHVAYVHRSLTKAAYLATNDNIVHPISDQPTWLEVEVIDTVLPP